MSGVKIFYPNALVGGTGSTLAITQFEDAELEFNWEEVSQMSAGSVFPQFTGMESQKPEIATSTTQIQSVIEAMTFDGTAIPMIDSFFEWQQGANMGTREPATANKHTRVTASRALFYWKTIQANETGLATLDFCWKPVVDASANPVFIPTFDQTLDQVPAFNEAWRVGPVVLNYNSGVDGSAQSETLCNSGWTWDNNIQLKEKTCAGLDSPSYTAIEKSVPVARIPVENIEDVLKLYRGGTVTSVDFFLRRALQGGTNVPATTASHMKLSSAVGTAKPMTNKSIGIQMHSWTYTKDVTLPY